MNDLLIKAQDILVAAPEYALAIQGFLGASIVLFALIPGEQPEKTLQKIVNVIGKFSRKKK